LVAFPDTNPEQPDPLRLFPVHGTIDTPIETELPTRHRLRFRESRWGGTLIRRVLFLWLGWHRRQGFVPSIGFLYLRGGGVGEVEGHRKDVEGRLDTHTQGREQVSTHNDTTQHSTLSSPESGTRLSDGSRIEGYMAIYGN
jgi:hypothetical protein